MKNKYNIITEKDYRSGRDKYIVVYGHDYESKHFDYYDQAIQYIQYMNDKYYVSTDPYESKEKRLAREKAIKRNNKIDQILGE